MTVSIQGVGTYVLDVLSRTTTYWSDAGGNPAHAERLAVPYPRPMYGIFVARTVRNWTFASSGRLAM